MDLPPARVLIRIKRGLWQWGELQINVSACEWQVLLFSEFSITHLSFFVIGLTDTCYPMTRVPAR